MPVNILRNSDGYIAVCAIPFPCWSGGTSKGEAIKRLRQQLADDFAFFQDHPEELSEVLQEDFRLLTAYITYQSIKKD